MRLVELQAENFKRLVAVRIKPTGPLTPIVGRNGAGKTSILDAIEAALGGAGSAPDMPIRTGQTSARIVLNLDSLTVTRRFTPKGSTVDITYPDGKKQTRPQDFLDGLYGTLAFDPLAFTRMKPGEQAETLARIAGVDLAAHRTKRKATFDERTAVNRDAKNTRAQLAGMPEVEAPDEEVSIADVIGELNAAQEHNTKCDKARRDADALARRGMEFSKSIEQFKTVTQCNAASRVADIEALELKLQSLRKAHEEALEHEVNRLAEDGKQLDKLKAEYRAADAAASAMVRVDTALIQERMKSADIVNAAVRQRKARRDKLCEATAHEAKANGLTTILETLDAALSKAIADAALPVPGLALSDDGVSLNGIPFSQCSGAQKLRTSVAIGFALNPTLRLMLIRDGSLLDADGMTLLAGMAEQFDAQVLIERVATTGEVGVRIEDGEVAEEATGIVAA